jgi:hypothetical protein
MNEEKKTEGNSMVKITINNSEKMIHRGNQKVFEIKTIGGVPLADDLNQLVDGKLTPLNDDGSVVIKGEEIFISHPKDSSAS